MKPNQNNWLIFGFIVAVSLLFAMALSAAFPWPNMPIFVGNYYGDGTGLTNVPVSSTNGGTVTSIAAGSAPGGFAWSGLPITTSGSIGLIPNNTAGLLGNNGAGVTSFAPLSGAITSSGFVTSLGTFSSANLLAALTTSTGTGLNVFGTGPTLSSPIISSATASTFAGFDGAKTLVTASLPSSALQSALTDANGSGPNLFSTGDGGGLTKLNGLNITNWPAASLLGNPTGASAATVPIPLDSTLSFVGGSLHVVSVGASNAFNPTQFSSNNNVISIKSAALITNPVVQGTAAMAAMTISNAGSASAVWMLGLDAGNNVVSNAVPGGGSGVTSFNTRVGAVTFIPLTDFPNALTNNDNRPAGAQFNDQITVTGKTNTALTTPGVETNNAAGAEGTSTAIPITWISGLQTQLTNGFPVTYYVTTNGSSANQGTSWQSPWDFATAWPRLTNGNTVVVDSGTYPDTTITGVGNATLRARYSGGFGIFLSFGVSPIITNLTIVGIIGTNHVSDGIRVDGSNCVLRDCYFYSNNLNGVKANNAVVGNNTFINVYSAHNGQTNDNTGASIGQYHNFYVSGAGNILANCVACNNTNGYGIQIYTGVTNLNNNQNYLLNCLTYGNGNPAGKAGLVVYGTDGGLSLSGTNWATGCSFLDGQNIQYGVWHETNCMALCNTNASFNVNPITTANSPTVQEDYNIGTNTVGTGAHDLVKTYASFLFVSDTNGLFWPSGTNASQVVGPALSSCLFPTNFFGEPILSVNYIGAFGYRFPQAGDGRTLNPIPVGGANYWQDIKGYSPTHLPAVTAGTGMSVTPTTSSDGSTSYALATTGAPPTGPAGGALSGTYPNPGLAALQSNYPQALTNNDNRTGGAVLNEPVTFTNNSAGMFFYPTGTNLIVYFYYTNSTGAMVTNTITVGGAASTNGWNYANAAQQIAFQITTNGNIFAGTNQQLYLDTTGNLTINGVYSGNGGSLTNLNGQSLTGLVQFVQWDASAFMTNGNYNSNAITYVTPSAGSGGLQGSAPFYLLYPLTPNVSGTAVACTNQFFTQTYMPPDWNSNAVAYSVDVVLATNGPLTATTMVFSVSASWNGSALTTPVTTTNNVPLGTSFLTTNFFVGPIPTSGTITPNESVVFQVQYWSVGNGKITNNAWVLGARCIYTNSVVQNGAVTLR